MFTSLLAIPILGTILKAIGMVIELLTPFLKFLVEEFINGARLLIDILRSGIPDIMDNWKTIVTVIMLMSGAFVYGHWYYNTDAQRERAVASLRKDYKFVPRNSRTNKKPVSLPSLNNPLNFDWLWR